MFLRYLKTTFIGRQKNLKISTFKTSLGEEGYTFLLHLFLTFMLLGYNNDFPGIDYLTFDGTRKIQWKLLRDMLRAESVCNRVNTCSHLCVELPNHAFRCLCPENVTQLDVIFKSICWVGEETESNLICCYQ